MQAPKQNIKMKISDILWFDLGFYSHKEKMQERETTESKAKGIIKTKMEQNKRNTTTKKKKDKTPKVTKKQDE